MLACLLRMKASSACPFAAHTGTTDTLTNKQCFRCSLFISLALRPTHSVVSAVTRATSASTNGDPHDDGNYDTPSDHHRLCSVVTGVTIRPSIQRIPPTIPTNEKQKTNNTRQMQMQMQMRVQCNANALVMIANPNAVSLPHSVTRITA